MFNLQEIDAQYEYALKQVNDLENIRHPLINFSDVIKAYYYLADYFLDPSSQEAETMSVGIRSYQLLGSAIGRQIVSYGGKDKYTDPIEICSTLFYGLVTDHAFVDGNKRTALLVLIYQLQMYGYFPKKQIDEFESLVIHVAERSLQKKYSKIYDACDAPSVVDKEVQTIASVIKRLTEKQNRSYHLNISAKDFCDTLSSVGVKCTLDNNKIKFERTRVLGGKEEKKLYAMVFSGWTRPIKAGTARSIFDRLNLTEDYPTYHSVFDEEREPFYKLIRRFEAPLRRLKDE